MKAAISPAGAGAVAGEDGRGERGCEQRADRPRARPGDGGGHRVRLRARPRPACRRPRSSRRSHSPAASSSAECAPRCDAARHGPQPGSSPPPSAPVEEDDVDREAHERGVHRPGRPDQHPVAAVQPARPSSPRPRLKKPSAISQRSHTTCPSGPTRTIELTRASMARPRANRIYRTGGSNHPRDRPTRAMRPTRGRIY